jgi:hypothetical protein
LNPAGSATLAFRDMFIKANLYGIDLNKASGDKVPEATGVITGKQEFGYRTSNSKHRQNNCKDIKHLMSLLVFNRVYRREIKSVTVMLVFSTGFVNYYPSNLL